MRRTFWPLAAGFGLFVPTFLLCPALMGRSSAQAPPTRDAPAVRVNPLFRPLLARLQSAARIPILLPLDIPAQRGTLVADLGVGRDQYTISVHRARAGQRLDFSNQIATVSGRRGGRDYPLAGESVALAGGEIGRYLGPRKAAPYAFLQWHQGGCVYDLGLVHGTRAQMKAMADWAILHPIPRGGQA